MSFCCFGDHSIFSSEVLSGVEGLPTCIYLGGLLLIVMLPGVKPGNCSIPSYNVIAPDSAEGPFFSGYSVAGSDDEYQPQASITHPFL